MKKYLILLIICLLIINNLLSQNKKFNYNSDRTLNFYDVNYKKNDIDKLKKIFNLADNLYLNSLDNNKIKKIEKDLGSTSKHLISFYFKKVKNNVVYCYILIWDTNKIYLYGIIMLDDDPYVYHDNKTPFSDYLK